MKKLIPNPRTNWSAEGRIIRLGEFRESFYKYLAGPRISELTKLLRHQRVETRYVIGGQFHAEIRHVAFLHFRDGFVRFTVIVDRPNWQPTVVQLEEKEFLGRLGVAVVESHYIDSFAEEATYALSGTLGLGNRDRTKFQLETIEEALRWLGLSDCRWQIE